MKVSKVELRNFRNYDNVSLTFGNELNLFVGNNAQGKTNLLEAIVLIALGKSHRHVKDSELVKFGCTDFEVALNIDYTGYSRKINYRYQNGKREIFINGSKINKVGELIGNIIAVLFSPEDVMLVKESPQERRRFIDMMICQIYPGYFHDLLYYNKILANRNKLLKEINKRYSLIDTIDAWDYQLVTYGARIIKKRREFLEKLTKFAHVRHTEFTKQAEFLEVKYETRNVFQDCQSIDDLSSMMMNTLRSQLEKDINRCNTSVGPHRDDISISINALSLKLFGSQGQQRSAILSLKFALVDLIYEETGEYPILLLDDVLSELDIARKEYIVSCIGNFQTILTATDENDAILKKLKNSSIFHVEEGRIILR